MRRGPWRAVRSRAEELGLTPVLSHQIPLPGLQEPRSQLAVPLRARGRVLGVLLVESQHDQYFGYDDEDALMLLCGQFALALTLLQPAEVDTTSTIQSAARTATSGASVKLRRYANDNSIFLDGEYLIRGVAGAILWKLMREYVKNGRAEFTNRELRGS